MNYFGQTSSLRECEGMQPALALTALALLAGGASAGAGAAAGQCVGAACAEGGGASYAVEGSLEAMRAEALALSKARGARYMDTAKGWVKKALKAKKVEETGATVDDVFKMCWSALNNVVAALELDGRNPALWRTASHLLTLMVIKNQGDGVQNTATVLKFMQHAVSLEAGGDVALQNFRKLLGKVDPKQEYASLWWQLKRWESDPAQPMVVKDVPFDARGERDDMPSSTALRSDDPTFQLPQRASPLLADNDDLMAAAKGVDPAFKGMKTHLLWPTRVSVVNLVDEGLISAAENLELSEACVAAYEESVQEAKHKDPQGFPDMTKSDLNNAFFSYQQDEIYDPDQPDRIAQSQSFGKFASVARLWKLQHRLGVEHAIRAGGGRPQKPADFKRNVMFPWCAAYKAGTGHRPHVHEDSIVSGVYYAKALGGSSPIILSDTRGGDHHATAGAKSATYMPEPPFHHQYYFYPKAGDLIIFPSYLVHEVPNQAAVGGDEQARIVWPFNLYGDLESWSRANA